MSFKTVMSTTERAKICRRSFATFIPRYGMVDVTQFCGSAAAWKSTCFISRIDEIYEVDRGLVFLPSHFE
jgi:predicted RNA-binding protein